MLTRVPCSINRISTYACPVDWRCDTSRSGWTDYDLWLVLGGKGVFRTGDRTVPFGQGECLILMPHETYLGAADPDDPPRVLLAHFEYDNEEGDPYRLTSLVHRRLANPDVAHATLTRASMLHRAGGHQEANILLMSLLLEVVDAAEEPVRDSFAGRLEEARRRIDEHPERRWSIAELAHDVFCTPDHFARGFAARFGTTPKRYVLLRKVDLACVMLRNTSYPVDRIARQLSLVDTQHLSRHFKAVVGVTPGAYRLRVPTA